MLVDNSPSHRYLLRDVQSYLTHFCDVCVQSSAKARKASSDPWVIVSVGFIRPTLKTFVRVVRLAVLSSCLHRPIPPGCSPSHTMNLASLRPNRTLIMDV